MAKYYNIVINSGSPSGPYSVYYVQNGQEILASMDGENDGEYLPASGLTYAELLTGVVVFISDTATKIILKYESSGDEYVCEELLTNCEATKYKPAHKTYYMSRNFWGNGPTLDLTDIELADLDTAITNYCADEKTWKQRSEGMIFYLDSTSTIEIGNPVYKYSDTSCVLLDKDTTIILANDNRPCTVTGEVAIRVENGYIVDKIIISA